MAFGRYSYTLTGLAILLAVDSLAMGWALSSRSPMTFVNLLLLWIILLVSLLYHIRRVNRVLAGFFDSFRNRDTTIGFHPVQPEPEFKTLYEALNAILDEQSRIKTEKEEAYHFFRAIFNHADVGLVVFDPTGTIHLINQAAGNMLGTSTPVKMTDLARSVEGFPHNLRPGEKVLVKIRRNAVDQHCAVRSRKIVTPGQEYTLLSLQNINRELEQKEVESWQKLIRVFIHEIMNSVTPITITATGIIRMLENRAEGEAVLMAEQSENLLSGLEAIRKRSRGMAAFMESYRQLTRIPSPDFAWVEADPLMRSTVRLLQDELNKNGIGIRIQCVPPAVRLWGDEKLIEQILINLLRNAADAVSCTDSPRLSLTCIEGTDRVSLLVEDNGPGMAEEVLENIFIPFFTTKAEGSGIGLSISRQIMNLHKGSISVRSGKEGTVFQLDFPLPF